MRFWGMASRERAGEHGRKIAGHGREEKLTSDGVVTEMSSYSTEACEAPANKDGTCSLEAAGMERRGQGQGQGRGRGPRVRV